jgi:hypothetical protein
MVFHPPTEMLTELYRLCTSLLHASTQDNDLPQVNIQLLRCNNLKHTNMWALSSPLIVRHIRVIVIQVQVSSNTFLFKISVIKKTSAECTGTHNTMQFMIYGGLSYISRSVFECYTCLVNRIQFFLGNFDGHCCFVSVNP